MSIIPTTPNSITEGSIVCPNAPMKKKIKPTSLTNSEVREFKRRKVLEALLKKNDEMEKRMNKFNIY